MAVKRVEVYDSDQSRDVPIFSLDNPSTTELIPVDLGSRTGIVNLIVKTIDENDIASERPSVSVIVAQKDVVPNCINTVYYADSSDRVINTDIYLENALATADTLSDLRLNLYRNNILVDTFDAQLLRDSPEKFVFNVLHQLDTSFNVSAKSVDIYGEESNEALCTFAIRNRSFDFPQSVSKKQSAIQTLTVLLTVEDEALIGAPK